MAPAIMEMSGLDGDMELSAFKFSKILTSGEGGIVITNNQGLYHRMVMYHDVVVGGMRITFRLTKFYPG